MLYELFVIDKHMDPDLTDIYQLQMSGHYHKLNVNNAEYLYYFDLWVQSQSVIM